MLSATVFSLPLGVGRRHLVHCHIKHRSTRFSSYMAISLWTTSHMSISEVRHWWGKAFSWLSSSNVRCWMDLRSGLCAGQLRSSTPNWVKCFVVDFVQLERAKVLPQSWKYIPVWNMYAVALRFPLLAPKFMAKKNSPKPKVQKSMWLGT